MDFITAGLGLLGGMLGGDDEPATQKKELDPRIAKYVFGADDKSGLLGDAYGIYGKQMATGGINDLQRQGLSMQQQYLMSPQYQQGNQSLYNLGMNLMGGGVAGNPFTSQRMSTPYGGDPQMTTQQPTSPKRFPFGINLPFGMQPQQPSQGFQYQPTPLTPAPNYAVTQPVVPAIGEADFEKWLTAYLAKQAQQNDRYGWGDGYGGGFGSGMGGDVGGAPGIGGDAAGDGSAQG